MGMVVQTQTQPFYWTTNGSRFYQYQHRITYKTKLSSKMRFYISSGEVFLRGFGDPTNLACNRQPVLSCEMDVYGCDKFWVRKRLIVVASLDVNVNISYDNLNLYVWLCNMFTKYANHQKGPRVQSSFLPEASFGLRVLSLPAYVCVCVSVVCLSVCQSPACPRDNSGPAQARIAKFGPKMQKTLVEFPFVLVGNWPWPSWSNLTSKAEFTPFWACPDHNSLPIQARITKFGPEVGNSLVKVPIILGGNWPRPSSSNLI